MRFRHECSFSWILRLKVDAVHIVEHCSSRGGSRCHKNDRRPHLLWDFGKGFMEKFTLVIKDKLCKLLDVLNFGL